MATARIGAGTRVFEAGAIGRVHADGVDLAFEWWPGPGPIVCLPGLTSHRRAFSAMADELSPLAGVLAFDLRGRGDSDKPDRPFGMAQHAADLNVALDNLGIEHPIVVAGHSMGAYAATAFAAAFPARVKKLVLIDGGYIEPVPGMDPDQQMETMLGPFLERLRTTYPSVDALCARFAATPLYAGRLDDATRRYFAYDCKEVDGGVRAKASEGSVAADWQDLITNPETKTNLDRVRCPTLLLRAPDGLTGTGDAVIPDAYRDAIASRVPDLTVVDLEGENHHSLLTTRPGAARTAEAIRRFLH